MLYREFTAKFPFESFVPNQDCTNQSILHGINDKIMDILHSITDNGLGLDVAFVQINALVCYAAHIMNPQDNAIVMNYYNLVVQFMLYGCTLGAKYAKYLSDNESDLCSHFAITSQVYALWITKGSNYLL
eukprot:994223_1